MAETEIKPEAGTNPRVVRHLSTIYFDPTVDPLTGSDVRNVRSARRGEEVHLVASEEKRLDRLGALLPKGSKPGDERVEQDAILDFYRGQRGDTEAMQRAIRRAAESDQPLTDTTGGIVDVSGTAGGGEADSIPALADRISGEKLTVDDTVALAGDDPQKARRVLEAEGLASGGSPRHGVESKLQKIIDGE